MAYHDTISPAQVLSEEITQTRSVLRKVGNFFSSMAQSASKAGVARARFETLTALQGKSDAELSQLGLKREDIVRHVFNDLYYS